MTSVSSSLYSLAQDTSIDIMDNGSAKSTPQIPRAIEIRYRNSWSKLVCFAPLTLHLDPISESVLQTSLTLSLPRGMYGRMILNCRQDDTKLPLAHAMSGGRAGYSISFSGSKGNEGLRPQQGKRWWFAFPVCPRGDIEKFEWRRSRGSEVRQLGGSRRGWKLVRLSHAGVPEKQWFDESDSEDGDPRNRSLEDDKCNGRLGGLSSDGKEVVAAWAGSGNWLSCHEVGQLEFRGSGASGELGQRWALMALMSSLCIWQKEMKDQATLGAGSASSSSAAVSVVI